MGSVTIVGKQNQLVRRGTSWRDQSLCGYLMSGLFRSTGTLGAELIVKENSPGTCTP